MVKDCNSLKTEVSPKGKNLKSTYMYLTSTTLSETTDPSSEDNFLFLQPGSDAELKVLLNNVNTSHQGDTQPV